MDHDSLKAPGADSIWLALKSGCLYRADFTVWRLEHFDVHSADQALCLSPRWAMTPGKFPPKVALSPANSATPWLSDLSEKRELGQGFFTILFLAPPLI